MKVYLETMGCQMNRLDSELAAGSLCAGGHEIVADAEDAEVVLYNTCSVRHHAEAKVYSRLGADGRRKARGEKIIVGVLGCMAQRQGEELVRRYPQVDLICAPGQLHRLGELMERAGCGEVAVGLDPDRKSPRDEDSDARMDAMDLGRDPDGPPGRSQAFGRGARGCDKFCAYCIVPFVRGPQRSRDPEHVAEEVRRLVGAGRSQITLLGQTVNGYLWKVGEQTVRFSDLLARISATPGLRRLRFVTSHPTDFGDDVLEAMRDLPNVCEYIHCPAQSGSDAVLGRMRRGYTRSEYDGLIDRAQAIVPGVALAGDFIVGFPGETDADHAASADLIRRSGYKNSFIFKYSPRPGTAAENRLPDDVPEHVKRARNNDLLAVQQQTGAAHHSAYVGKTVEVLVEGPSPKQRKRPAAEPGADVQLVGRTRGDHIVVFDGAKTLADRYFDVETIESDALTLFGRRR